MNTAKRFEERWNFPHCIGALDEKHIVIQAPPNSASQFHNYKGTFWGVLLALVDAETDFWVLTLKILAATAMEASLLTLILAKPSGPYDLDVLPPSLLPSAPELGPVPYLVVADEAFPMKPYLSRTSPSRGHASLTASPEPAAYWRTLWASPPNAGGSTVEDCKSALMQQTIL